MGFSHATTRGRCVEIKGSLRQNKKTNKQKYKWKSDNKNVKARKVSLSLRSACGAELLFKHESRGARAYTIMTHNTASVSLVLIRALAAEMHLKWGWGGSNPGRICPGLPGTMVLGGRLLSLKQISYTFCSFFFILNINNIKTYFLKKYKVKTLYIL